jgi:hypothetical protein
VVVQNDGGWGSGATWGYPDVYVVGQPCDVVDTSGNCVCQFLDRNGECVAGLGDDTTASMGSSTTWIAGGILVALAVTVYALDKRVPRRAA